MERALDLEMLSAALGGRSGLPTAKELQQLMAQLEVQLFLRQRELDPQLLDAAWYLHGVASVDRARELYTSQRQRQAFAVSAHIFDLALQQDTWTPNERLSLGFAAAIGYRRGDRDPNATAIMHRLRDLINVDAPVADHVDTLPLEAGLAFLGFQSRSLFAWFRAWRRQLEELARISALSELSSTVFGPAQLIVLGADDLLAYFAEGDGRRLQRGRDRLLRVITDDEIPDDLDARWVAAHLLALSDEAQVGSLWNPRVIPPSVPRLVRQAFTVGTPAVLTLWEPQRDLLTAERSPFDPEIRRMVLSVPTSGGKTLLAQLLAVEQLDRTDRAVCYVAPTRSLCREVRQAMSGRVRLLQKETGTDQPDFPIGMFDGFDLSDFLDAGPPPDVAVMTPERLSNLLRHDADAVLDKFGMFIFDEAQLMKETGRGFVLESTIAMLDYLTRDSEHRLVLISAAMGNAGAIAQWISSDGAALLHESAWRGPRRLHAVFTTQALFDSTTVEQIKITKATKWPYRHVTELSGLVRLRLAGQTARLTTQGDTGWRLVRKAKSTDKYPRERERDAVRSTRQYTIASEMMGMLGHAGSVLVVASTRGQAQLLASSLAEAREEYTALTPLVDFVRGQLGADHPLVDNLRHGVGFHHAGLPTEVQEALEQSVRDDVLPFLTCTSTLTDGVNLPVRTVVIYDQTYEGQPEDARLRGARLVNAIGRAGRAGKETEGWIVLVRAAEPSERDFADLDPDADALAVTSSLITDETLHELAALEAQLRADEDAIFREAGRAASDFISFTWLMFAIEELRGVEPDDVDIVGIVDSTLAANQSTPARSSLLSVARAVQNRYAAAESPNRRRWTHTGTSIGSARTLDNLASLVARLIISRAERGEEDDIGDPGWLLQFPGVLRTVLDLVEAPKWQFRTSSHGDTIDVPPAEILRDWLRGVPLADLAETHLAPATSAAWRVEQMVDAVTSHFEHFLSWTVGAFVELVNLYLADENHVDRVCPELGGYIRYGVDDASALILMTSGIRSRRLAHTVTADLPDEFEASQDSLRDRLASMGVAEWRDRYAATASEILDLLDFARRRRRSLLKQLLEEGTVDVELPDAALPATTGQLSVEPIRDAPAPAPLAVYAGDDRVATIASRDHADTATILDTGLVITLALNTTAVPAALTITLPLGDTE